MANIVFLNMADDLHVDGHKAVESLRSKHPAQKGGLLSKKKEQVEEFEIVPVYRAWKAGNPNVKDMARLKARVTGAKKVMLSVHGPMKAVDHAIIKNPKGADESVTYQDLGRFLLELFDPGIAHNFTLVTCFAARSSDYDADHQNLGAIDWTDSFAYKLFDKLCPAREVRMTARTGELSFNTVSGASEVQSELAIAGTIDNETISAESDVVQMQAWWNTNVGRLSMPKSPYENFAIEIYKATLPNVLPPAKLQLLKQLESKPGLPVPHPDTDNCIKYLKNLIRLTEASSRQVDPVRGKYGKLVYRYVHGPGICVFAKYPNPTMVHPVPPSGPHAVPASALRQFNK